MYCFGGNHRYSLFEDLWETLGATFGAILGENYSNPEQIDDFYLMRLFCLSVYIKNIIYWTTVIQSIKKIHTQKLLITQTYCLLFWLGISTQSANPVPGISPTVR